MALLDFMSCLIMLINVNEILSTSFNRCVGHHPTSVINKSSYILRVQMQKTPKQDQVSNLAFFNVSTLLEMRPDGSQSFRLLGMAGIVLTTAGMFQHVQIINQSYKI